MTGSLLPNGKWNRQTITSFILYVKIYLTDDSSSSDRVRVRFIPCSTISLSLSVLLSDIFLIIYLNIFPTIDGEERMKENDVNLYSFLG
jgi:hypothetical protein